MLARGSDPLFASGSLAVAVAFGMSGGLKPLLAQATQADPVVVISGDLVLASEYNWRGLTRVNGWVLQPDVNIGAPLATIQRRGLDPILLSLSAGAWANVELSDAALDEHADRGAFGLGEINPWFQLGAATDDLDVSLGVTRYFYRGDSIDFPRARTSASSTTELYFDGRLRGRRIEPRVTWWLDVGRVRGSYLETAATLHVPFLPFFPSPDPLLTLLDVDVVLGWNAGQAPNADDPAELTNFRQNGLTHAAFSISLPLAVEGLFIEPRFNVQVNRDDATRAVRPGSDSGANVWWSLVISPVGVLGLGGRR